MEGVMDEAVDVALEEVWVMDEVMDGGVIAHPYKIRIIIQTLTRFITLVCPKITICNPS